MRLFERFEKTIAIPVKIRNGQLTFLYGDRLPPLREGTEGVLIVPQNSITNQLWEALLSLSVTVELLPEGTVIGIMMKFDRVWDAKELGWIEDEIKQAQAVTYEPHTGEIATEWKVMQLGPVFVNGCCLNEPYYLWGKWVRDPYRYYLIKVCLQEPLRLELRGTSKPRLLDCRCHIPALEKHEKHFADSLNEAYTRISEIFEPTRRSHTGNVFQLCVVKLQTGWVLLDNLREICEAEYEQWLQEQLSKIEALPKLGETRLKACQKDVAQRIEDCLKQLFSQAP